MKSRKVVNLITILPDVGPDTEAKGSAKECSALMTRISGDGG